GSVSKNVRSCVECQSRKDPKNSNLGHLQSIMRLLSPFKTVGIDFLGPFPRSSDGNRYIIVSVDHLSKYSETGAVPAASSFEAALFYFHSIVLKLSLVIVARRYAQGCLRNSVDC